MAQGSHATWAGYPPEARVCRVCGEKVKLGAIDAVWLEQRAPDWTPRVWHVRCKVKPRTVR
jgi:hypothetical protein